MIGARNTDIFPGYEIVKLFMQKADKIKFLMKFENALLIRDIHLVYETIDFPFSENNNRSNKVAAWPVSHVLFQSF